MMRKRKWLVLFIAVCLLMAALAGCAGRDQGGDELPDAMEQGSSEQGGEQEMIDETSDDGIAGESDETGQRHDPNALPEDFKRRKPADGEMETIDIKSGADFDTISMEALQGYWYCDEGHGYEIYLNVDGDVAEIYETLDGEPLGVWTGRGQAYISQPGTNGWKNPGLEIRDDEGNSIALIVLRRVGDGYFTTANSGVYYRVIEK